MYLSKITNDEINQLEIIQYEGEIQIVSDSAEVETAFQEILQNNVVGFDTETKPNFRKGVVNPIALLQIATVQKVYLFQILSTGLVSSMIRFFESDVMKIGIALHDDIKALRRTRDFTPEGFCNLGDFTTQIGIENQGLRKLAGIILNGRISKGQQLSNWENQELTEPQKKYAATDAWACLQMYKELESAGFIA